MSLGTRSLYPFVLSYFSGIDRAKRSGLRVLDMPAGEGVLSSPLAAAGFDVTPMDLFPEYLEKGERDRLGRGVVSAFEQETRATMPAWLRTRLFGDDSSDPVRETALTPVAGDMESRLDFPDESFDIIACVEGIEHVMDRHRTLSELRRLLAPGGSLIITTPNLLSLRARVAYALAGQRAFKSYIDEYTSVWGKSDDGTRLYHGHAFLISYFQLRYSLHHCGFKIEKLMPSNWSPTSVAMLPFTPLVAVGTAMSQRRAKKKFARLAAKGEVGGDATPPYKEMFRHLLSPELLLNSTMIIEARAV
ncbi:MAG: class I SAM-dependent methyltransferase [Phycisphaerales bacterium]|nr:class I SAM-dependent methyltransferase [Phycisphaerales bacterium]MCB9836731.1 class I SAM-dependent methyltransferase [Phycisphaera sp.]